MCNTTNAAPDNAPAAELLTVRFTGLTDEAREARSLRAADLVARFAVDGDDQESYARFDDLVSYADMRRAAFWPAAPRAELLEALARPITAAPWRSREARTLALAERFAVCVEDDSPVWRWRGVVNLRTVDRMLLQYPLGGSPDRDAAGAEARWRRRLDLDFDRETIAAQLKALGCDALENGGQALRDPYLGLDRAAMIRCITLLAPLREAYLRAVSRAVTQASRRADARHVHLGREGTRLSLLADNGLFVAAEGHRAYSLYLAAAYDGVEPGEDDAGPRTRYQRWQGVVRRIRRGDLPFAVHSPLAWGVGRARR